MTQNLGSTSNPLSMTGEQWVLEERTDDPLSPEPGECWIRTDLNAGDKMATLKFGDGSEVPIFPTATSEPGVLEVRRVQTGGQTGYLPVAEPDESRFPQFRLQHNNTVYSLHDDIELGAIPDSVVDNFEDADADPPGVYETGETVEDYYIGGTSVYQRQTTTVKSGGHALEAVIPDGDSTNYSLESYAGLNRYVEPGDTFRVWFRTNRAQSGSGSDSAEVVFGAQDGTTTYNNLYHVGYQGKETFRIVKVENGSGTVLTSQSLTLSSNTWYEFEVVWGSDGSITARVFDETGTQQGSDLSTTDTTFGKGGVGFFTASTETGEHLAHYDEYRVV